MRIRTLFPTGVIIVFLIFTFVWGCGDREEADIAEEKEQFLERIRLALASVEERISELEYKAEEATEETREEIHTQLEVLEKQRAELRDLLNDVREAAVYEWDEMRDWITQKIDELDDYINSTR